MINQRNFALIILLFIGSIATISAEENSGSNRIRRKRLACPDESAIPDCDCQNFGTLFTFNCPAFDPTLDITVNEAIPTVIVKCQKQFNLSSLPNLEIGNISRLVIKGCGLDEAQPILETFGFLGVNGIRELFYDDYHDLQTFQYNPRHFEGLEDLENLTLTRGVSIQGNAFEGLSSLKRLTIGELRKLKLQGGLFDGSPNLEVLSLEYNKIIHLEDGLFENQGNLTVLSLAHNSIKNISKDMFGGLENLRLLNIQNNKIESLDADVFVLLPQLSELNIGFNPISSLSKDMLSGNRKLKTFNFRSNKSPLNSLPEQFLGSLPQLKTVNLDNSKISHLPDSLFRQSTGIVELNLAVNKLTSLPETLLHDQPQLQNLNLAHNLLETIPDGLLENNLKLTTLRLSHNRLRSLSGNVFGYLKNLKRLYLENNNLQTIDHYAFIANRALEELHLQNNQLAFNATSFVQDETNIGDSDNTPFQHLNKLHTLKLQNNSISTIFIDWNVNNLELRELDLSNNRISQLEYAELQFQSNISVNLSNNNISFIFMPSEQIALKQNQKILVDLSNNPLNCDCNVLDFVQYVQRGSTQALQFNTDRLSCAEPKNLRSTSVKNVKTEELTCVLNDGCPTECTCDLRQIDYTIIVNCNGRGLSRVPELPPTDFFGRLQSIELHFEDNLLTELPTTSLFGYDQVTRLYARNNSVGHLLPEHLPTNLRLLDISQNQLQTVDDATLVILNRSSTLSGIRLSGNRWRCNCEASHLLNFIQRNQRRILDMPEVRCNDTDLPFGSITVNDLCNEDLTRLIAICVTVAVMGLTVGLLSTLFYRYQIEVKVWLFTHNLFLWLITEEELDRDKRYDAFLSYSHLDEDFITDHLVPTLEKEPMNFRTCWHVRDFMPGEMIFTQIIKSIEDSRRTVIVLSKNFLQSHWAKEEFRQAHVQSMEDNRVRVIVVIYDDIGDVEKLDPELRAYLKTNTYVKWGDPWFWDKLRYAMPHPMKIKGVRRDDVLLEQVQTTVPKSDVS